MSSSFDKYQKRKLISSYFSVILSIALVLFLLGLLGLLVLNAKKVADHFKEQVTVTIYLKDTAKEIERKQLEKSLAMADYVKSTIYVSKEQAAESLKLTAPNMKKLKLVDSIIKEPLGGAHTDREKTFLSVRDAIVKTYEDLKNLSPKELVKQRMDKYSEMGDFKG